MRDLSHSVVRADGLTHSYGDRRVLDGLTLTVAPGRRVGLIGENGAGKSTLLRLLAGVETPDDGTVERPARTGLLWQEVRVGPDAVLDDLIERELAPLRAVERELTEASGLLGTDPTAEERYSAALEDAERSELWSIESRRDEMLDGLGVGDLALDRPVASVSGGQRSRVALAALLLAKPDALLLDEPTNHLDDAAVAFLSRQLAGWSGALVFASHDRAFLDEVATELLDIDPSRRGGATRYGKGTSGRGVFGEYLAEKAAERARWEQRFAEEESELSRLGLAVAVTARTIENDRPPRDNDKFLHDFKDGRIAKQVSRRVRNAQGRLDDLTENRVDAPPPVLRFAGIPSGAQAPDDGEPLVRLEGVRVAERLDVPELVLLPDARILVTGANGAGKSTLLSVLAGTIAPDAGGVRRRRGLRVGLLSQDVTWADPVETPRRLWERRLGSGRAESLPLGSLGLIAERDLDRPVGRLSIGQQRRMALALTIAKPPHLFLLDEPTNHLSLGLATELEDALGTYPGAVVLASHDRWLRSRWQGETLALERGRVLRKEAAA